MPVPGEQPAEVPPYLEQYGQIREEYREDVLARAGEQLVEEGWPPSVLLASHLLVGYYLRRQAGELVAGEPYEPEQVAAVRGINLNQRQAGELAIRLAGILSEVTYPEEKVQPSIEADEVDASDSFGIYLRQVRSVEYLSKEETAAASERLVTGRTAAAELAERAEAGRRMRGKRVEQLQAQAADGLAARNELVMANLPFAIHLAKNYTGRGIAWEDLVGAANKGLIAGTERWDLSRGKYATYVGAAVNGHLKEIIANESRTIRVPINVHNDLGRLNRSERELAQANIAADTEAIAKQTGWEPAKVARVQALRKIIPRAVPLGDEGEAQAFFEEQDNPDPIYGIAPPSRPKRVQVNAKPAGGEAAAVEDELMTRDINAALSVLSEREAGIVRLRFGFGPSSEGMTLDEAADMYGITRERARQIETKAFSKLRHPGISSGLRVYLGGDYEE